MIERFHQVVDAFLREAKAHKIRTLEELNRYWDIYLEDYYHQNAHEGIAEYYKSLGSPVPAEGITPLQEWNRDSRPLVLLHATVVAGAFLHHEERLVDKGACISFQGRKYETKPSLIGCRVGIAYDPSAPETVTVSYAGMEPFQAEPLKIGSFCDKAPALPESMRPVQAESSRFLDVLEKRHGENVSRRTDAISFGIYRKDGGPDV
ncbi:Mu transposase C-terminal domain-containing protein [Blautia schinkii]|nr:Mu transposase C-terminal domain-containing protein [Blautia schinkii]